MFSRSVVVLTLHTIIITHSAIITQPLFCTLQVSSDYYDNWAWIGVREVDGEWKWVSEVKTETNWNVVKVCKIGSNLELTMSFPFS